MKLFNSIYSCDLPYSNHRPHSVVLAGHKRVTEGDEVRPTSFTPVQTFYQELPQYGNTALGLLGLYRWGSCAWGWGWELTGLLRSSTLSLLVNWDAHANPRVVHPVVSSWTSQTHTTEQTCLIQLVCEFWGCFR